MCADLQPKPAKSTSLMRRGIIYVTPLIVVFLRGFVPMWLKARECSRHLSEAEHQLNLARMQNFLASAVIDARRGDYESARQAASDFFTSLRTETRAESASALSEAEIASLQPLITQRDEIITALARGEPTAADLLSDLYVTYRDLVSQ